MKYLVLAVSFAMYAVAGYWYGKSSAPASGSGDFKMQEELSTRCGGDSCLEREMVAVSVVVEKGAPAQRAPGSIEPSGASAAPLLSALGSDELGQKLSAALLTDDEDATPADRRRAVAAFAADLGKDPEKGWANLKIALDRLSLERFPSQRTMLLDVAAGMPGKAGELRELILKDVSSLRFNDTGSATSYDYLDSAVSAYLSTVQKGSEATAAVEALLRSRGEPEAQARVARAVATRFPELRPQLEPYLPTPAEPGLAQ